MMTATTMAFPCKKGLYDSGLTERDYVAIQAMQGILSHHGTPLLYRSYGPNNHLLDAHRKALAEAAYAMADAMIAQSQVPSPAAPKEAQLEADASKS